MPLLNYSTKISPEQTIGEIQKILSRHGVQAMMTEYEGRNVASVSFKMLVSDQTVSFRLPCKWSAVLEIFKNDPVYRRRGAASEEQAIRTSWRIIKEWVDAQLALVEINMVTIPQVFLPYSIMKDGRILADHVAANPAFLLVEAKK